MILAKFVGGSLDGTQKHIAGAREYIVPCRDETFTATAATWLTARPEQWNEVYTCTALVRGDGPTHVVMTYARRVTIHSRRP